MNKTNKYTKSILFCGMMLALTSLYGCASKPTVGDRMMNQGEGTSELGNQWSAGHEKLSKGEKLIKKGEGLIKDAREDMRDGEDKVIEGRKLVEEGKRMMDDSERRYKTRFPQTFQRIYENR